MFSPYSIICVPTSIVLQQLLSLVFVLRAPGKVKGLGGFLLLQPPPSYIPIIISAEYEQPPKIQPDRDLQPLLQVHFSNQVPEIKISHVKKNYDKKMFPSQPTGEKPLYCRRCQSESSRAWALPCSARIPRESERIPTRRNKQSKRLLFRLITKVVN